LYQGLRLSRPWLALVLVVFCLPLFVGLGRADLETDEAIYSYAVDRILEIGDWLEPRLSPSENDVFLEKPPLKFWLVAAPIKAGLLPHDEFGLRFLDAVAGGVAFVYVFAIGSLLAGPVCGVVAVLLLFIHIPLVMVHGLRTNNMEAPLVLSYCAGVFHFLRWAALDDSRLRARHVYAAALYFVLGFMTKFVAALFLPFTLGIVVIGSRRCRRRLVEDWRTWARASALVLVLCVPWFVYAHVRFGAFFWETIFGVHVLMRLTNFLDPTHLHPWYFYLQSMWDEFVKDRVDWLIAAGIAVLLVQTIRRRWLEGTVVLLWAVVPLAIISAGTSKLYHYAYPFLPPFALAGGYLAGLVMLTAPAPLRRLLETVEDAIARVMPGLRAFGERPGVRRVAAVLIAAAGAMAFAALSYGVFRIGFGRTTIFRSSGVWRPLLLIVLLALATRTSGRVSRLVVALIVFNLLPLPAYRGQLQRLPQGRHPIRTAAECVQRVQAQAPSPAGLFVDIPEAIWHPLYYYFRRVQPWTLAAAPLDPAIDRHLHDPAAAAPILVSDTVYREYTARSGVETSGAARPPMVSFLNTLLLLPGQFSVCSSEAVIARR
jgi:4-amino-4-deoxy-L-arabinose transferase-like glycosyltransferase